MRYLQVAFLFLALSGASPVFGGWLEVLDLKYGFMETDFNGTELQIEYDLKKDNISPSNPAWVFIRYSHGNDKVWLRVPETFLTGDGFGIVSSAGHQQVSWWGVDQMGALPGEDIAVKVYAMAMARVPGGRFVMKSTPGGGYDGKRIGNLANCLPEFYMAQTEMTVGMYADYLNETGKYGADWDKHMADSLRCGITRRGDSTNYSYSVIEGRGEYPVTFVSWYDAVACLDWCGLQLPTEAQWEKAWRGGSYLDGDSTTAVENPQPERRYPWGNELPDERGVYRCNGRGEADGFPQTAPVSSFEKFTSPYGIFNLAGNVAEWTRDWYTTNYHEGLDGIRIIRGGSWRSLSAGLDAISGATSQPADESAITGFRGVTGYLQEK